MKQDTKGAYAEVNGLKMYYEVHGAGKPVVLLHGAFGVVEGWSGLLPALARTRQVIMMEMQGHGRTGDIDRPLSFEQMADDTAALLKILHIEEADLFGYSMGGTVALGVAIRHPELVRRVAILGSGTGPMKDTSEADNVKQFESITPETFNFPAVKDPYLRVAPDPTQWQVLVAKIIRLVKDFKGYAESEVRSIQAETLIMLGDRDGLRPEHAVEMYRLIPHSQLAIYPYADHFVLFASPKQVLATLLPFFGAPIQE